MRPRIVFTIFRKDLTEVLRDRRTVIMAFVVPALIYPVLFTLLGSVSQGVLHHATCPVAVVPTHGD
jgi:sodium transport system permease protein